jgi:anaerobic selenocysteine-containing dehydrogenase
VHVLDDEGLIDPGAHIAAHVNGLDEVVEACRDFDPVRVEAATGLAADDIRRLARELAAAPSASIYARIGTTTSAVGDQAFGTTASWLVDVVNTLTGNLDRPGGAMFATPVAGGPSTRGKAGSGAGFRTGRGHSRVRSYPEVMGEYPVGALAEEITTPGSDQVRALVTVAGNPVLSTPNNGALDAALADLDFMVSVDIYLNETTQHADVILPPPSQLQRDHYDVLLLQFAVRNVANYSEPVLARVDGEPDEWEILAKLALIAQGLGAGADPAVADDLAIAGLVASGVKDPNSPIYGRDADEILAQLSGDRGPARMLDYMLQTGPFGAAFGAGDVERGASLALLRANPHGVDFGALVPRIPEILRTPSGRIELAPAPLMVDLPRLLAVADEAAERARVADGESLVLVGRRHLRSNNSWMHNIEVLVKGKPRCTLQVHPQDAARLGLADGAAARISSSAGSVDAAVEVTDAIRPGVVSLPHGWGHGRQGTRLRVASERAGVSSNVLADPEAMDPLSGTAVLNGIVVQVTPA